MLTRRKFAATLAVIPAALMLPFRSTVVEAKSVGEPALQLNDTIRKLEQFLETYPNVFSYGIHNDLRHHYLPVSEKISRMHADIILAHRPMDHYILNTLSDWHLTNNEGSRDPMKVITVLVDTATRYSSFLHLKSACLITAAQTYNELNMKEEASKLYREVIDSVSHIYADSLNHYVWLAHQNRYNVDYDID
jgi:hypothetical protein